MESPGEYLKREREQRGITLDAVHEKTRVPKRHLIALESDDYENLPHPTFVKGFIKAYCSMLGLDENDAVLRYDIFTRESGGEGVSASAAYDAAEERPVDRGARSSRNNLIIGACVAAGIVLILIFYAVSSRGPVEPVPAPVAAVESAVDSAPPSEEVVEPAPEASPETDKAEAVRPKAPAPEPKASPKVEVKAKAPAPAQVAEVKAPVAEPAPQAPAPAPAPTDDKKAVAASSRHTLKAKAIDTVWVQLSIDNGEPFDVMLRRGEELTWTAINVFSLVVGNAAGISVVIDGEDLGPLGAKGEVVRLKLPDKSKAAPTE